jgi:protein CpxP
MKKIILSAAFLAIGTFAMAQQNTPMQKMQKRDPAQMEQRRADNMKQMQSDLGLSTAQVAQITALQDKKIAERKANAPQIQADRKAKMEKMKGNQEQWNAEMKQILTPDQYQKWQAKKQEKMQDRRGKMQDRKMNKMPAN